MLGGLLAVADFPVAASRPAPAGRGAGRPRLEHSVCLVATGRLGLRLAVVRLTENPMPVDGLVVDQAPRPLTKARRDAVVTVRVWHPAKTRA